MPLNTKQPPLPKKEMRAFPTPGAGGMALRDYFAAAALPALVELKRLNANLHPELPADKAIAIMAYELADAMMERRNGPAR